MKTKLKNMLFNNKLDITIILVLTVMFILLSCNFAILNIVGSSMYPSYENKDIVILKKTKNINQDDILIFKSPKSWQAQENKFIKRVVAIENDKVTITNKHIFINGVKKNHYKKECSSIKEISFVINKDEYLVMGDNTQNSNDSITEYCMGNKDFLIKNSSIITQGQEFLVMKGW